MRPLTSTLFPYTTLFRSQGAELARRGASQGGTPGEALEVTHPVQRFAQAIAAARRSEEHTSELQSLRHLVCRLLLEKKNKVGHNHHGGVLGVSDSHDAAV